VQCQSTMRQLNRFKYKKVVYSAEFGGANGGLINMQLKTGKEHLRVTLQGETDNYTSQGTNLWPDIPMVF